MKKNKIGELITYSREIKEAIKKGIPIVALESSIISHGMPYPHSLEMAKEIEDLIRSHGARPATLAILDGKINVGLDAELLDAFAKAKKIVKVSSNNFEATMFSKKPGGTTVAGSLKICDLLSIKTFVTGGIGGVHREFDQNFVAQEQNGSKYIFKIMRTDCPEWLIEAQIESIEKINTKDPSLKAPKIVKSLQGTPFIIQTDQVGNDMSFPT